MNFKPGYIVLLNGDTARCTIDYRNWDYNPDKITVEQNNTRKEYTPADLLGFAVDGQDIYRRFNVTYHLNPTEMSAAGKSFSDQTETAQAFLRLLYPGTPSLYQLNTRKREYYFVEYNGTIKEMIYRVRLVDGVFTKDEQYKTVLAGYITDPARAKAEKVLNKMEYDEKDFIEFFVAINGVSQKPGHTTNVPVKKDILLGFSYLPFTTNIADIEFKSSLGIKLGMGFIFSSRRNFNRIQSRVGLTIHNFSLNWQDKGVPQPASYDGYYITAEPNAGIGYILNPLKKTKSMINADFGFHLTIYNKLVIGNTSVKSGFASGGVGYSVLGKFGRAGIQAGAWSNLLDSSPIGPKLSSLYFSMIYCFVF